VDRGFAVVGAVRRDVSAKRLRLLLQLLERQPETHQRVALTLHSIVRDTELIGVKK